MKQTILITFSKKVKWNIITFIQLPLIWTELWPSNDFQSTRFSLRKESERVHPTNPNVNIHFPIAVLQLPLIWTELWPSNDFQSTRFSLRKESERVHPTNPNVNIHFPIAVLQLPLIWTELWPSNDFQSTRFSLRKESERVHPTNPNVNIHFPIAVLHTFHVILDSCEHQQLFVGCGLRNYMQLTTGAQRVKTRRSKQIGTCDRHIHYSGRG